MSSGQCKLKNYVLIDFLPSKIHDDCYHLEEWPVCDQLQKNVNLSFPFFMLSVCICVPIPLNLFFEKPSSSEDILQHFDLFRKQLGTLNEELIFLYRKFLLKSFMWYVELYASPLKNNAERVFFICMHYVILDIRKNKHKDLSLWLKILIEKNLVFHGKSSVDYSW